MNPCSFKALPFCTCSSRLMTVSPSLLMALKSHWTNTVSDGKRSAAMAGDSQLRCSWQWHQILRPQVVILPILLLRHDKILPARVNAGLSACGVPCAVPKPPRSIGSANFRFGGPTVFLMRLLAWSSCTASSRSVASSSSEPGLSKRAASAELSVDTWFCPPSDSTVFSFSLSTHWSHAYSKSSFLGAALVGVGVPN